MRILIAEDEADLNATLVKRLLRAGYGVDSTQDGAEALAFLQTDCFDAAILDIMLPGMSGLEVLRSYRAHHGTTPVLLLTARDAVADRVEGLDSGAEDYMTKPFAFEELLARLRAMTRRGRTQSGNCLRLEDLVLDMATHQVRRGDKLISLSSREYGLLEYLMRNQGVVLSREQIESNVWGLDYCGGTNVVDVYVRYLRQKLEKPGKTQLIHTVRGVGYVMRWEHG